MPITHDLINKWRNTPQDTKKAVVRFLGLLLLIDLVLMLSHALRSALDGTGYRGFLTDARFSIEQESGYSEIFEYIKTSVTVFILVQMYLLQRKLGFLSWALIFTVVLIDNAFGLHEHLGGLATSGLKIEQVFGLNLQDAGELLTWAFTGLVLLVLLATAYRDRALTSFSNTLMAFVGLLALFAVGVDVVHSLYSQQVTFFFGFIEDGGELLTLSLITTYVYFVRRIIALPHRLRSN